MALEIRFNQAIHREPIASMLLHPVIGMLALLEPFPGSLGQLRWPSIRVNPVRVVPPCERWIFFFYQGNSIVLPAT